MAVATAVVEITAAMAVATAVVEITAAMVVAILNLILLTVINLPEQKVGKIEVMEIPLKTPNMKVGGAGEKGESPMRAKPQTKKINNPFL